MGNCESDVLGPSDGGLVGWSLKACRSVHPMGPGWADVRILGVCWDWETTECSEVPKLRLLDHLDRDPRAEGRNLLLDVEHRPQWSPSANGHECPVRNIGEMHGHGSARAERVCSEVFWSKAESGRSHLQALGSDDGDVFLMR